MGQSGQPLCFGGCCLCKQPCTSWGLAFRQRWGKRAKDTSIRSLSLSHLERLSARGFGLFLLASNFKSECPLFQLLPKAHIPEGVGQKGKAGPAEPWGRMGQVFCSPPVDHFNLTFIPHPHQHPVLREMGSSSAFKAFIRYSVHPHKDQM